MKKDKTNADDTLRDLKDDAKELGHDNKAAMEGMKDTMKQDYEQTKEDLHLDKDKEE